MLIAQIDFMLSLIHVLNDNWYLYKLMNKFRLVFQKNSCFIFQLYLFSIGILLPLFLKKNILFLKMLTFLILVSITFNWYYSQIGICWPNGYNPQFCVLMMTKHMKLFGTNQVQECVSGFRFKKDLTDFFL